MKTIAERFWPKVDRSGGPDACWPWTAFRGIRDYGHFGIRREVHPAHRIAWRLEKGEIPDGMMVCHRCDNPPCCNPAHLFIGTATDNVRDMVAKGRHFTVASSDRCARGDRHGSRTHPERMARGDRNGAQRHPERLRRGEGVALSRLTEQSVREVRIRHSAGETYQSLAGHFGVSYSTIERAATRNTWRHVA